MARDTVGRTFLVAFVLCVVCSVLVAGAAVGLRERQELNKTLDIRKNILIAAGLYDPKNSPGSSAEELYEQYVERVLVDLDSGEPVDDATIDPATYLPREAARSTEMSEPVEPSHALPGISRREKYAFVYLVHKNGNLDQVVLPIYGKGLWSTLYGFIAINADTTTVNGITFYEHKETPGLGGEVDNPHWKALWPGKKIYDDQGIPEIEVVKGRVDPDSPKAEYQIDGLSGATITTRGVSNLVRYWLGENGFEPYLAKLRGLEVPGAEANVARESRRMNDG